MVKPINCRLVIVVEKLLTKFLASVFPVRNNKLISKAGKDVDLRVEHRCSLHKLLSLANMRPSIFVMTRFSETFSVVIKTEKALATCV